MRCDRKNCYNALSLPIIPQKPPGTWSSITVSNSVQSLFPGLLARLLLTGHLSSSFPQAPLIYAVSNVPFALFGALLASKRYKLAMLVGIIMLLYTIVGWYFVRSMQY